MDHRAFDFSRALGGEDDGVGFLGPMPPPDPPVPQAPAAETWRWGDGDAEICRIVAPGWSPAALRTYLRFVVAEIAQHLRGGAGCDGGCQISHQTIRAKIMASGGADIPATGDSAGVVRRVVAAARVWEHLRAFAMAQFGAGAVFAGPFTPGVDETAPDGVEAIVVDDNRLRVFSVADLGGGDAGTQQAARNAFVALRRFGFARLCAVFSEAMRQLVAHKMLQGRGQVHVALPAAAPPPPPAPLPADGDDESEDSWPDESEADSGSSSDDGGARAPAQKRPRAAVAASQPAAARPRRVVRRAPTPPPPPAVATARRGRGGGSRGGRGGRWGATAAAGPATTAPAMPPTALPGVSSRAPHALRLGEISPAHRVTETVAAFAAQQVGGAFAPDDAVAVLEYLCDPVRAGVAVALAEMSAGARAPLLAAIAARQRAGRGASGAQI